MGRGFPPRRSSGSSTSTSPRRTATPRGWGSDCRSPGAWRACLAGSSGRNHCPTEGASCSSCRPRHHHEELFIHAWRWLHSPPTRLRSMKILVVEDDRKVAGFIEQGLKEEGYVVDVAPDGDEATMLAHVYEYDMILLDVVLPKKNGFQVATELRREGRHTPILMLTSRDAVEDVVRGLDAGADDYLAKPFRFDELLARIRALHRRGGAERLEVLRYGPLTLDRLRHTATINDQRLDLTPKEFQLLEYFLLHPEEVIRRTTLLEKVWDMHFDPESNVVDVHVGNLRRPAVDARRRGEASRRGGALSAMIATDGPAPAHPRFPSTSIHVIHTVQVL